MDFYFDKISHCFVERVTRYENEKLAKLSAEIGQNWPLQYLKMATNRPQVSITSAINLSFLKCFTAFFMMKMIS